MFFKICISSLLFFLSYQTAFSQNEFRQKVVQVGLTSGYPIYSGFSTIEAEDRDATFSLGGIITGDAAVFKRFSIGIGLSYQVFKRELIGHPYTIDNDMSIEDVDLDIMTIAYYVRTVYHFHNLYERSDRKFDLYWGAGYTGSIYDYKTDSPSPLLRVYDDPTLDQTLYGLFGFRYYPIENLGIQVETSFPTNYFISIGLAYRFDWKAVK